MARFDSIINNEVYIKHIKNTENIEKDRIFCHHDTSHFLDVARIAMILNLEEDYGIDMDVIYAAALLHDVGRDVQYEKGIPHEIASADISRDILNQTDYTNDEQDKIIEAIERHRDSSIKDVKNLSGLIYRADKLSRACFFCSANSECDWKKDKKNNSLVL